jgi:hypothetical protein
MVRTQEVVVLLCYLSCWREEGGMEGGQGQALKPLGLCIVPERRVNGGSQEALRPRCP